MSNQLDEKFLRISNRIMDALYRVELSGNQFRVVNYILRRTYGTFDACQGRCKTKERFSSFEIASSIHIDAAEARRALRALVDRKIVVCYEQASGRLPGSYGIEKNTEHWELEGAKIRSREDALTSKKPTATGPLGGQKAHSKRAKSPQQTSKKPTASTTQTVAVIGIAAALDNRQEDNISSSRYIDPNSKDPDEEFWLPPDRQKSLRSKALQILLKTSPSGLSTEPMRRLSAFLSLPPPATSEAEAWGRRLLAALREGVDSAFADKIQGSPIRNLALTALSKASQVLAMQDRKQAQIQQLNKGVTFIQ